jgi:hypothetical protein
MLVTPLDASLFRKRGFETHMDDRCGTKRESMIADAASDICLALITGSDTSASVLFVTDTCKPSLGCTDSTQGECVFTYTYAITDPAVGRCRLIL